MWLVWHKYKTRTELKTDLWTVAGWQLPNWSCKMKIAKERSGWLLISETSDFSSVRNPVASQGSSLRIPNCCCVCPGSVCPLLLDPHDDLEFVLEEIEGSRFFSVGCEDFGPRSNARLLFWSSGVSGFLDLSGLEGESSVPLLSSKLQLPEPAAFSGLWAFSEPRLLSLLWSSLVIWLRRSFKKFNRLVNLLSAEAVAFVPYCAIEMNINRNKVSKQLLAVALNQQAKLFLLECS